MCKICTNDYKGLKRLDCNNCPLLTNIPNIEGLKSLYCNNCPLLTNIPNIEGLNTLCCNNCPLLITIPIIERLNTLHCIDCPLLITIPIIERLKSLCCNNCPLLMYVPLLKNNDNLLENNDNLLKQPFENCKYKTSKKMDKLYNNIFYLYKLYKLKQYVNYLESTIYSNPRLPYMKYYIEHKLYDTNNGRLKIGYLNSKEELSFYHL